MVSETQQMLSEQDLLGPKEACAALQPEEERQRAGEPSPATAVLSSGEGGDGRF